MQRYQHAIPLAELSAVESIAKELNYITTWNIIHPVSLLSASHIEQLYTHSPVSQLKHTNPMLKGGLYPRNVQWHQSDITLRYEAHELSAEGVVQRVVTVPFPAASHIPGVVLGYRLFASTARSDPQKSALEIAVKDQTFPEATQEIGEGHVGLLISITATDGKQNDIKALVTSLSGAYADVYASARQDIERFLQQR